MSRLEQLSVITDEISQDFEHALKVAAEYCVKCIDVRKIWNKNIALFTNEELELLKETLMKYDMKIGVVTGPFGKCYLPSSRFARKRKNKLSKNPTYNMSFFERLVEIADFFNTKYIRIFAFLRIGIKSKEEGWKEMIHLLNPYIKKAEAVNKILLVENDLFMNVGTIEQTKRFFNDITSKSVKLVLDPGNYFMEGEPTTPDAYEYFYNNNLVGHFHVKDPKRKIPGFGATFGVVGEGKIDYKSLFKQAIDHEYKGYFCLETHSLMNKDIISRKSLENMKKWLEEL